MSKVFGLYGHIQRNLSISRWIIAGFFVATCICWVLCNVSYNVGFRQFFGEEQHYALFHGGGFGGHAARMADLRAEAGCTGDQDECPNAGPLRQPAGAELAVMGVQSAFQTMYLPIAGVIAWLALFWFQNGKIVRWATGAIPASRSNEKRLYNIVENLSIQTGEPMPRLEIIESEALNAFASGLSPKDSTIGVTRGLLTGLNDRELQAVVAHEYTHILNGDSRVMSFAAVFVGIFENLFYYFLSGITGAHEKNSKNALINLPARLMVGLVVFAPLCASFAVCWVPSLIGRARLSRAREFLADAGAVELTKDAGALVSALQRISQCNTRLAIPSTMQAMMIADNARSLFASHPPIEERVAALRAYGGAEMPVKQAAPATGIPANPRGARIEFGQRGGNRQAHIKRVPAAPLPRS